MFSSFHFTKPALGLLAIYDRFVLPIYEDQYSLPKRKRKSKKKKQIEKEKEKKKNKNKVVTLCLETRARSEGCMVKAFEARCPKPSLVGSHRPSVHYMGG